MVSDLQPIISGQEIWREGENRGYGWRSRLGTVAKSLSVLCDDFCGRRFKSLRLVDARREVLTRRRTPKAMSTRPARLPLKPSLREFRTAMMVLTGGTRTVEDEWRAADVLKGSLNLEA